MSCRKHVGTGRAAWAARTTWTKTLVMLAAGAALAACVGAGPARAAAPEWKLMAAGAAENARR